MGNEKRLTPYQVFDAFFDEGSFNEIDAYLGSGSDLAEAVTGYGTVDGVTVFAFAQNADICGGAMSTAQAKKITKLYSSALKVGAPVVGFYDSIGGRLEEKYDLLAAYGDILRKSSKLSGVVPQISVVLGNCVGTSALIAGTADFVIMTKDAQLTLSTTDAQGGAASCFAAGTAQFVTDTDAEAVLKAKALLAYLPANNLEAAPAFESAPAYAAPDKLPKFIADEGSLLCVSGGVVDGVCTAFGRVDGMAAGFVVTNGGDITPDCVRIISKHVRFCDAFSIPIITLVNAKDFTTLSGACALTSAYAQATTAKISVISGTAFGAVYNALAGSACSADVVLALPEAIVSPVTPKAAAYLLDPSIADLPYAEQDAAIDRYVRANLSAAQAAADGYVDDIAEPSGLRSKIIAAMTMLSTKRVATLPKKHSC